MSDKTADALELVADVKRLATQARKVAKGIGTLIFGDEEEKKK